MMLTSRKQALKRQCRRLKMNTADKHIQETLNPEIACTDENPEKLSNMMKSITSKNNICKQSFKVEKPRTRLRKKM